MAMDMATAMATDIMKKTRIKMQYSETLNVESDKH
jgi:hypothetical protein